MPRNIHDINEPHAGNTTSKLNWLRASVLGANDGIVSISGLVLGVAGATSSTGAIFTAGLAGIVAGAISMAAGEYVSVSSSRDSEKALLTKEQFELKTYPEKELEELTLIYQNKGLSKETAKKVAKELTAHDVHKAHYEAELGIDPAHLTNPYHAAAASAAAFFAGAIIPFAAILIPPPSVRIPATFASVVLALAITGFLSAKMGKANILRAMFRVVLGGILAMTITYAIGYVFGVSGI